MFGNGFPREEFIEKMAAEVIELSKGNIMSLSDAVIKKSSDRGLNQHQIENLCARVNHIKFREAFAVDKLATFDIAKIDDVLGYESKKVASVSETIIGRTVDPIFVVKVAEQGQEQDQETENAPLIDQDLRQNAELYDMAISNADATNAVQHETEIKDNEIYDTVKSLVLSGESLGDVYEVLLKTWGKDNIVDINDKFMQIINRLKTEGYLNSEEPIEIPDVSDMSDREVEESPLAVKAAEFISLTDELMRREYVHYEALEMMKQAGMEKHALAISKMVDCEILSDEVIKVASGIPLGAGMGYAQDVSSLINPLVSKGFANPAYKMVSQKGILLSNFSKRILPVALAVAGATIAKNFIDKRKYQSVRQGLLENPDFAGVDDILFDSIYSTLIERAPDLLDTPYALAEIMKKHIEYGTIDSGSLKDLDSINAARTNTRKTVFDSIAKATEIAIKLAPIG